ncbi:Winged helix-turn-helix DNA-binding domain,Linker histone H1/H5, domain H15,Histone H5 [Cinara cedri]|uniref:Winged helix-turn-helix DNA-binding domain,Linker histone H1/H5, domain H15,Histone H5 n=1 Tax=Cinara cedri TaxID=506608 RepID=A0A5E4N8M5_9HEMI|nr:Winged helix-turn-helix DNA-binding domain,Linker histone H1/H5, domain H15,Histone H5 [Cinara cedri]
MTDTLVSSPTAPVVSSPALKKKATTAAKSAAMKKPAAAHPPTSIMVTSAIKELKERKGSSLPAIKKYLAASYQVDPAKMAPFIRKFLSAAVTNGAILQTKGHYKLAVAEAKPKKNKVVKKPIAKKLKPAPASTPKKKKVKIASGEPAAKKAKKTSTKAPKKVVVKPKNAPAKSTAGIPKTLKKTVVKKVIIPK